MKLKLVGDGCVCTVLVDAAGLDGHAELLTGGDYTFCELGSTGKGIPFTPLNGLASAGGQRLLLGELRIEQLNTGVLKQLSIIECLELAGKGVCAGKIGCIAGVGVDIVAGGVYESTGISEKLKVDCECANLCDNFVHDISPLMSRCGEKLYCG